MSSDSDIDVQAAMFEAVLPARVGERTVSASEIEAMGGLTTAELFEFLEAFGLATPASNAAAFTPREAEVLVLLKRFEDVWPADARIRTARLWGRHLARIAQFEVQELGARLAQRFGPDAHEGLAGLRVVQEALTQWQPIAEAVLVGLHQRWVEHELGHAAVGQAEAIVNGHALPGAIEVAIVFCDLTDFTAYADLNGDGAAVASIERFGEIVAAERGEHVRLTKLLGDGAMLVYGDAHHAVAAAARILAAVREHDGPDAHASVHRGVAVAREGDYFGSTVNLTARLLSAARRHELIATQPVALATSEAFKWEHVGVLEIRGIADPVDAFRMIGPEHGDGRA